MILFQDREIKGVIFDMDGVIFDSERLYKESSLEVARLYGIKDVEHIVEQTIGVTYDVTRAIYLRECGEDFPYKQYMEEVSAGFNEKVKDGIPLKEGVKEILVFFQEKGLPVMIASSTQTPKVRKQTEDAGIAPYFKDMIGGEQCEKSKPNPDIFLKAMEQLGLLPENCMIIEDSFNGVCAAHASKALTVMIPDLKEPTEEIRALTDCVCPSLSALKEKLEKNTPDHQKG
jgi:beta-phosphoglucomutase-like phosphatase (HAD superfamily)